MTISVAINGFSCRLPMSASREEFWENLVSNQDMISEHSKRWPADSYDIPPRFGVMNDIDLFDAQFFDVHGKQANKMDPQMRFLLEVSYEAFVDSGINPFELKDRNVGVFVGACASDALANATTSPQDMEGYENTGTALSMLANRLSYFYDLTGPSKTVDTACSSGLVVFDEATRAIQSGQCDMALVGAANIILRPGLSTGFKLLNMLAEDGKCKAFDEHADGYVRSEGVVVLVLTAKSKAARIRAEILGTATNNDGYTDQGITFPNTTAQEQLLNQLYTSTEFNAEEVEYIEAHGTGTQAGDPVELGAIDRVLAQKRSRPLRIGSVKTNMGHSEGAAGLAGMSKVLLAMEHGMLPANLHFTQPNSNIESLQNGNIRVLHENMPWSGGIVGINSFGFGGTNAHAIIRGGAESVPQHKQKHDDPGDWIVPLSHRTQEGLDAHLEQLKSTSLTTDQLVHLQRIANIPARKNPWRSCIVHNRADESARTVVNAEKVQPREVWWVFSGMGSQWEGMGKPLLENLLTRSALEECGSLLEPMGVDLFALLTEEHGLFDHSPKACFVAISAMQVAMVDLLVSLDVPADRLMGHSLGEIACAYADGALTKQQTMEVAFLRGQCLEDTPQTRGKMAAVELSWKQAQALETTNLFAACHNGENSVTLSGPGSAIDAAVDRLTQQGVESRVVGSAGIAFHTPQLDSALPAFKASLTEVVSEPKHFSERWISTCLPASDSSSQACDVNYLLANLRNPVQFNTAIKQIPDDAIVVEVGPTTLFYSTILSQKSRVKYTGLSRRGISSSADLNCGIARLFSFGIDINWQKLNPSHGTLYLPGTVSRVSWSHKEHEVPLIDRYQSGTEGGKTFEISLAREEYKYVQDHKVAGKVLFPGVGYLHLVWQLLAEYNNTPIDRQPVHFSDIKFLRATRIDAEKDVTLTVRYSSASGSFEVVDGQQLVATGSVTGELGETAFDDSLQRESTDNDHGYLDKAGAYTKARLHGYQYGPEFQSIERVSTSGLQASVEWRGNWVSFLDAMLQVSLFRQFNALALPTSIRSVRIDPSQISEQTTVDVFRDRYLNTVLSMPVEIEGLETTAVNDQWWRVPVDMARHEFVPYFEDNTITKESEDVQRYAQLLKSFLSHGSLKVIENYQRDTGSLPPHLVTMRELLQNRSDEAPQRTEVEHFMEKEDASMLRVAASVFANGSKLVNDPLQSLFSHEDYAGIYAKDYLAAHLFRAGYVEELFSVIYENFPVGKALNICEAGCGTGGLTSRVLPTITNPSTRYLATDVSTGFFGKLQERFSDYQSVLNCAVWNVDEPLPDDLLTSVDVFVASNCLHLASNLTTSLTSIYHRLEDGGFLLLHECVAPEVMAMFGYFEDVWDFEDDDIRSFGAYLDSSSWKALLTSVGFELVSVKNDGDYSSLFLCRKPALEKPGTHIKINESEWSGITRLQAELDSGKSSALWLHGNRESAPGLLGLTNCARYEPGGDRLKLLYNDDDRDLPEDVKNSIDHAALYQNVVLDGVWGSYRHVPYRKKATIDTDSAALAIEIVGDLSSMKWELAKNYRSEGEDIQVAYGSLNFKDIMLATGRIPATSYGKASVTLIDEFSGVSKNGGRVMGMSIEQTVSTRISRNNLPKYCVLDVPESWTLAQAATVPVAYYTAYCALQTRARITAGQSVLIHSALSAVGQACIRIALSIGCEVYVTVGTEAKQKRIHEMFPAIAKNNIGHSRDRRFERWIMNRTQGKGVDVIVNSLAGELLHSGLRVISKYGKFIEIGKYDMSQNTPVGMGVFLRDVTFMGVGLNNIALDNTPEMEELWSLMKRGISDGVVVPLTPIVFGRNQTEEAFRLSAKGEHTGKVMLALCEQPDEKQFNDPGWTFPVEKCFWANPEKSYLITGGLGGFGLELGKWLVSRGARSLVLTSRSGLRTPYQKECVREMERRGVHIVVSTRDASDSEDCRLLLSESESYAPVGGVFHLAMVLQDALLENQTKDKFRSVLTTKLDGGRHLDYWSRELCQGIEHFVVFSSLAGGLGNRGQSNYGYANTGLDRLCEQRKEQGYPALSIQWGLVGDVGFVQKNADRADLASLRTLPQGIGSCLSTLDSYLTDTDHPVVSSYVRERADLGGQESEQSTSVTKGFSQLLKEVSKILGLPNVAKEEYDTPFVDFGLDSLMSVEIITVLDNDYLITLDIPGLRKCSFAQLAQMIEGGANSNGSEQLTGISNSQNIPVENSSAESTIKMAITGKPVIEEVTAPVGSAEAIYFLAGVIIDPVDYLTIQSYGDGKMIYAIRYDRAKSFTTLFEEISSHMADVSTRVDSVKLVGYSAGAMVAHRFLSTFNSDQLSCPLKSVSVSPAQETVFDDLITLGSDALLNLSDEELIDRMKSTDFWTDLSQLSHTELKQQLLLLLEGNIKKQDYGVVDLMILPANDPHCWPYEKGKGLAKKVLTIDADHESALTSLREYFF